MTGTEVKLCCRPNTIVTLMSTRGKRLAFRADRVTDVFECANYEQEGEICVVVEGRSVFTTKAISFDDLLVALGWACPSPDTIP